jgi:hypothetical protein
LAARLQKTNHTMVYMNMSHPYESIKDPAERASKSLAFIEELKPKYFRVAPYVLFDLMRSRTSEPSVQEAFRKLISELKSDPSQVAQPKYLFDNNWDSLTLSLFDSNEELAMEALLLKDTMAAAGISESLSDKMHVAKGVFLMNRRKFAEAIEAFEKVGVRMVQMDHAGPWGCGSCPCGKCPVSALALAERCQKLMGGSSKRPGFHVELEKSIFRSEHERPLLSPDGDSVWVGDSRQLIQFRANGEKIAEHKFNAPKFVSALTCGPAKLYVGTMGGGLLEVDKATMQIKVWRSEDGLLSDHISDLKVISHQLWIGYGHRTDINAFSSEPEGRPNFGRASTGGAGLLDISSGVVTNYFRPKEVPRDNPSIWQNKNNYGDWPPSLPTLAIEAAPDASIYMAIHLRGLQQFEPVSGKWSAVRFEAFSPISSIQASPDFLCVGQRAGESFTEPEQGRAIWVRPRNAADFTFFSTRDGLPHDDVGALLLDGKTLWVGGFGYVAELQLADMKVVRVLSVPSREVTHLVKSGENLWVSTEDRVFQVKLGN